MRNDCKIVQDLFPNYIEKVTSKETNEYIEEHMKNCEECSKIYEEMGQELNITSLDTKMEVDYMKKFNGEVKKLKLWKKVLIIIGIILVIYFVLTLYKYVVLTNLYEKGNETDKIQNGYYYSETDDYISESWKKDNVIKTHIKRKEKIGDIIMWENFDTGEKYVFWNEPEKKYQEGGQVITYNPSMFLYNEGKVRFLMAINPLLLLFPKNYDGKQCYYVKMFSITEIIERETGLPLYENNAGERTLRYTFNTVTDDDVAKPDLSSYALIESNSK